MQEIFLPVHSYVVLHSREIAVVNFPEFQRLRNLRQLGFAHFLFPGATHTRFEHSIGTLHVAEKIISAVNENATKYNINQIDENAPVYFPKKIDESTKVFVRLAALLHDIGHIPFGHTFEDELCHIDKHDGPDRLNIVADRVWKNHFINPELDLNLKYPKAGWSLRALINQAYAGEIRKISGIERLSQEPTPFELLEFIISKPPKEELRRQNWDVRSEEISTCISLQVCRDIVGNTICADFLDYLFRDWYHLGKMLVEDPRLYHYMEVREDTSQGGSKGTQFFVVNAGTRNSLRHDAITSILDLLQSRYKLAETVLFHRTKLSIIALLDRVLLEVRGLYEQVIDKSNWEKEFESNLREKLLSGSDDSLAEILSSVAFGDDNDETDPYRLALKRANDLEREALSSTHISKGKSEKESSQPALLGETDKAESSGAAISLSARKEVIEQLMLGLRNREIYTKVFEFSRYDLTGADIETEQNRIIELYRAPANRSQFLSNLEAMCQLPAGTVTMYCSTDPEMNAKVARVNLLIDDNVKEFVSYESDAGENGLTGGALEAQIRRFQALWRALVFVRKDVWSDLDEAAKQDLRLIIHDVFVPTRYLGGDITNLAHYRKGMQERVENVRKNFGVIAARSGTVSPQPGNFVSDKFPNGLPCI